MVIYVFACLPFIHLFTSIPFLAPIVPTSDTVTAMGGGYPTDIIHAQPGWDNPSDAQSKTIEKQGRWIIEEY